MDTKAQILRNQEFLVNTALQMMELTIREPHKYQEWQNKYRERRDKLEEMKAALKDTVQ